MAKPFVDMDLERAKFLTALHSRQCKLVLIEGEAGTGKSTLLNQFRSISEHERIPSVVVNFRDSSYSPMDVIYSMANLIGIINCPNLQAAVLGFAQASDIVIKDNRLTFGAKLTIEISSELNQKTQQERNLWYRQITTAFFDDLAQVAVERAILFLDTYEQCDETVVAWVNTHLLPLLGAQSKLQVVMAGQKVAKLDVEWEDLYIKLSLTRLELHYWYKYIELRQATQMNPEWVVALYKIFDGRPAAMVTALEKLLQESALPGGADEEKYWALLNVYLEQVDEPTRTFVEALSVFHWFDDVLAEQVWTRLELSGSFLSSWSTVIDLPFVAPSSRGIAFHELYRNALLFHLWRDRREFYLAAAALAARYFESEDPYLRIELAYHLLIANPLQGRLVYRDIVVEFQDNGIFSAWNTLNQYGLEHIHYKRLDPPSAALIWEAAGQFSSTHGKNQEAVERLTIARTLYQQTGDKVGSIRVLYSSAAYRSFIGQVEESKVDLQTALELAQSMKNPLYIGHITYRLAEATSFGGDPKKAYSQYQRSYEWFVTAKDYAMQARNLKFMAETSMAAGIADPKSLYQQAIPLFERGWIQYSEMPPGDPGFSPETFIGGFSSMRKVKFFCLFNVAVDEGDCLDSLADLEDSENQKPLYEKAQGSYQRALPFAQHMKDLRWIARVNLRLGDISLKLGQTEAALSYYQQAFEQASKVAHKLYIGWSHVGLGDIARLAGDKETARQHYMQARELYLEVGAHSNIRWQIVSKLEQLDHNEC